MKFKHKGKRYFYVLFFCVFLTSCVSLNTHQTGKSLGKGNNQYFGNFNYGSINSESFFSPNNSLLIAEFGFFNGISNKTDIGFKIGNTFKLTGLAKSQIIGNQNSFYASSLGLDLGVGPIELLIGGAISYNSNFSFINSVHPNDYLSITFTPKFVFSGISRFRGNKITDIDNLFGYTTGVILGRKTKFSIEIAQFNKNAQNIFRSKPFIGIGVIFGNVKSLFP